MKGILIVGVLLLAACQSAEASSHDIVLSEFKMDVSDDSIESGRTQLSVSNTGEFAHTVVVANVRGKVLFSSPLIAPGTEDVIDLELPPGTYEFTCRIVVQSEEGDLIDHYERGMRAAVTARG